MNAFSSTNETNNYTINVIEESNAIYFNGDINNVSMENLINTLLKMELAIKNKIKKLDTIINETNEIIKRDTTLNNIKIDLIYKKIHINLYITTNGGGIYDTFGAIDVIKSMEIPVHTICKGCVASAGTLLSLAGKKDLLQKIHIC